VTGTAGRLGSDGPGDGPSTPADILLAAFARWAAEQRVGAAAESRSRERWLRQQAAEAATLVGTLVDLAEQRADVAIVVGARTVSGRLIGVGRDGCIVAEPSGGATVVPLARLDAVRVAGRRPGTGEATGERSTAGRWGVADALATLAAERSAVRLGLRGGETLSGVLVAVGEDVLTVQLPAGGMRAHVAFDALETVTPT
jgi:hypothetical protein